MVQTNRIISWHIIKRNHFLLPYEIFGIFCKTEKDGVEKAEI
jgi:hypothetical protein